MNYQFSLFRIIFGSYLLWHFLALIPYGTELFSNAGILADPTLNLTAPFTPHFLNTPFAVGIFLTASSAMAFAFMLGIHRRLMAGFLWFSLTALFLRNNLISNPSLPYLGLILILTCFVPVGEPWSISKKRKSETWKFPRELMTVAMILLAVGYTFSGWTKLSSPSWTDGSAFRYLLENPLARPSFVREFALGLPDFLLQLATWSALALELLFLPLACFRRTRPWAWLVMLLMHLCLIILIDFADLSLGMVMIHLFTFDPKWLPARKGKTNIAFDGDCLMCNQFIHLLAEQDTANHLRFSKLPDDSSKDSMIVTHDEKTFTRSGAIIAIAQSLGGHWRALAIMGRIIPRSLRNWAYHVIAKNRYRFGKKTSCSLPSKAVLSRLIPVLLIFCFIGNLTSCTKAHLHMGRFPFSLMDRAPGGNHLNAPEAAFQEITTHKPHAPLPEIRNGDIIAFHLSHRDAWSHLRKGQIQKIPYEVFSFGHLALALDGKLLQLAMNQRVNTDSDFSYLEDKRWILYRPTSSLDEDRLREFVKETQGKKYDYLGVLGIKNAETQPDTLNDISDNYTCVTAVQAALHYAGHRTKSIYRKGLLDIVTPAQFIRSKLDQSNEK